MITKRHPLYKIIRGQILHATSVTGLQGILADQCIRPNLDGTRAYNGLGEPDCYHCQSRGGISVLDLVSADERRLFDAETAQNWIQVFTYNHPTIALILRETSIRPRLERVEGLADVRGRFILEAEACCRGEIPIEWIAEGVVVGKHYRPIWRSHDLCAVVRRAEQVRQYSHRKCSGVLSLMYESIEPVAAPNRFQSRGR